MNFAANFPCFLIVLSLAFSAISVLVGTKWARRLSLLLTVLGIAGSGAVLALTLRTGENIIYKMGQVSAPWGNELRLGSLEAAFAMLVSLVLLLCLIGGEKHVRNYTRENTRPLFYICCDLAHAALLVLSYTNDIFTGYVFIEICTIASCGILIIRNSGRTTAAATRYMIFSLVGSGLFLLGVITLYGVTGHLLMPQLKTAVAQLWETGNYHLPLIVIMSLIAGGLAIKSGLFPFHFWMADTYGTALPGSAGILSGIISKGYIFFLIKVIFNVFGTEVFYASGVQNILFVFGIGGMIVGSISAIRAKNVRHMIAYSSAAQIGYIYMGIGLSPESGVIAALFHIVTHALTKPGLFLSASRLADVSGHSNLFSDLTGAGHRHKIAGLAFLVGAMSMVGIPGFMGFISKLMFGYACMSIPNKMLPTMIALAISTILNVVYFLRTVICIYTPTGDTVVREEGKLRSQIPFLAVMLCFIVLNVVIGVWSEPVISLLEKGVSMLG